jgi:hypothetical protein
VTESPSPKQLGLGMRSLGQNIGDSGRITYGLFGFELLTLFEASGRNENMDSRWSLILGVLVNHQRSRVAAQ